MLRCLMAVCIFVLSVVPHDAQSQQTTFESTRTNDVAAETRLFAAERLSAVSDQSGSDVDPNSVVILSRGDMSSVTALSRDGSMGYVSVGGGSESFPAGTYQISNQGGELVVSRDRERIDPIDVPQYTPRLMKYFQGNNTDRDGETCPGFSCGCWADPLMAEACFTILVCNYVGVCPP
ncbi:hypothetical protein OCH239_22285 [Roseivivax halodurans JCM 10272]|uniref:Uncharacterized protein n=1 Tax=Roseivivax halodurans JCM 10272 TaxID=1449350 RepID=X7E3B3_9RHOB|nr:hypothetical protein [Roseivivax halodurans]ETX10402.1 hypothetical protein OCH239_22285 [Roseivivax halodurans JCM 10272]